MSPLPSSSRALLASVLALSLAAPVFARGGGGGGGAGFGPGGRGPGVGSASGRSAGRPDSGPGGGKSGGGHHGGGGHPGGGHHHHPIPIWWFGGGLGFGGFGGFGYASPFYDPFYDGWYGRRLYDDDGSASGDNVTLRVKPENASVYVNGVLYSSRGRGHFNLPAGEWAVELRAPGYLPQTVSLRVEQGVHYTVERKLEKDRSQEPAGKRRKIQDLSDT